MKKLLAVTMLLFVGVLNCAGNAYAHLRTYAFTEEYRTIPQGNFELEQWTTFQVPDGSKTSENSIQYQSELEYGLMDHWTISNYERWKTKNVEGSDDSTNYEGFKFETKYRIGERGKYWVDPLVYLEWKTDPREHEHHNELEAKLVLSKDFGKFNVAYNHIGEWQLARDGRANHEFRVATSYEVLPEFRIGTEFAGDYWAHGNHMNSLKLGPTIGWESKYFWVVAGALFGLNHVADDHEVRLIVGVPLPFDSSSFFKKKAESAVAAA